MEGCRYSRTDLCYPRISLEGLRTIARNFRIARVQA